MKWQKWTHDTNEPLDLTSFKHEPWIGKNYRYGIAGRKIAVVGSSHRYKEGDVVVVSATITVMSNVISKKWKINFFSTIPKYFKMRLEPFWSGVLFFNYAPRSIDFSSPPWGKLAVEDSHETKMRFLELLLHHAPDKVFVFSDSIRSALPIMRIEDPNLSLNCARVGTLISGPTIPLYLLPHPQDAAKPEMTEAVTHFMDV